MTLLRLAWALPGFITDPEPAAFGRDPARMMVLWDDGVVGPAEQPRPGHVEIARWPMFLPLPPPSEVDPIPDFDDRNAWTGSAPEGLGTDAIRRWPGAGGDAVVVGNVEYALERSHVELASRSIEARFGEDLGEYRYHGNGVFGLIGAVPDGEGTSGVAPDATLEVYHPMLPSGAYVVAAAIRAATADLLPGDVLLIEQQSATFGSFGPPSADPTVFAAIRDAVDAGIVVVEPGGNGGLNLDDPRLEGWYDRDQQDSGAILVAAWQTPGVPARFSAYGARVDVLAPGDGLAAPTASDGPRDLYDPGDPDRAYTGVFGGTSGASAIIAGLVAQLQGISLALHGAPLHPVALREGLRRTGTPIPWEIAVDRPVGAMPDAEAFVATYLIP